ncbi:MAG: putative toxin-antitoxin system toxin component, PIN family [Microbacterium sp.]
MRVVIDCNVVISAVLTDGTCRAVVVRAVAHDDVFVSAPILDEYRAVSARPKYRRHRETVGQVIRLIESVAYQVEPLEAGPALPDPNDTVYLATALAAQADAIITGNTRDFPPRLCAPVRVLTPREYLEADHEK